MNGPGVVTDDAFISFRYARNLSHGNELVFNVGERVEGYTNFLWVVLLSLSHRAGLNIVLASKVWAYAAGLAILVTIWLMADHIFGAEGSTWPTALSLILLAGVPSQPRYVVSGMETLLFTALLSVSVYLFLKGRSIASGSAFALTAMTRPEGVMYFAVTLGFAILMRCLFDSEARTLRSVVKFTLAFLLAYGPYFLWRYHYYGHLLPNTFYAKASGVHLARFRRGWQLLREVMHHWRVLPVLLFCLLALPGRSYHRVWLLFAGLISATFVYFVWVGGDFIVWFGPRFLMPVFPMMLLTCAEGVRKISHRLLCGRPIVASVLKGAVLVALAISTFFFSWAAGFSPRGPFSVQMRGWTHLGRWLGDNSLPDSTIATDAAGIIPYYSERYTIDMFGLTDEHIGQLETPITDASIVAHEKYDPEYILEQRPHYIVSTWLDEQGHAISAGLGSVRDQFQEVYGLVAVAKVKQGFPRDGQWVVETSTYSEALYHAGYLSGVFKRVSAP